MNGDVTRYILVGGARIIRILLGLFPNPCMTRGVACLFPLAVSVWTAWYGWLFVSTEHTRTSPQQYDDVALLC